MATPPIAIEDDDDTVREALNEIDRQVSEKNAVAAPTTQYNVMHPPPHAFPPQASFALPAGAPAYAATAQQAYAYPQPSNGKPYSYNYAAPPPPQPAYGFGHPPPPQNPPPATQHAPPHRPVGSLITFIGDEARMWVIVACVVVLASSHAVERALAASIGYAADSAAGPMIILIAKVACAVLLSYIIRWAWSNVHRGLAGVVWG